MTEQTKQAFLARLRDERKRWLALLDEVDRAWVDEPGVVGKWSVRELVAHVAVWETWGANVARSVVDGRDWGNSALFEVTIPPEDAALDYDTLNEWLTDQRAGQSYEQVVADEAQAYQRFVEAFEALDESDLPRPAREFPATVLYVEDTVWSVMKNQSYHHWEEHTEDLEPWLARRKSQA